MNKRTLVIASGDPAGCGPLVTLEAIDKSKIKGVDVFLVGDRGVFEKLPVYKRVKPKINLIDLNTPGIEKIKIGYPSKLTGQASINYLKKALEVIANKKAKRLVTAPLSKEAAACALGKFSGHTEYLANHFKTKKFAMLMTAKKIKVLLLTRHISLSKVSSSIKKEMIADSISLLYFSLRKQFKIKTPKIAIASVNPHAGINTFLEKEERVILSAISELKHKIHGPYPADTLFTEQNLKKYDCIACSYHDQAMIPFKLLAFQEGVNVTLGLPIIRTSPAHGIASDIVKKGKKPFSSSMSAAIDFALRLFV